MEALIILAMNVTVQEIPKYIEDTLTLAISYFQNHASLTVISTNFEMWGCLSYNFTVIFQNLNIYSKKHESNAIILDNIDNVTNIETILHWTGFTQIIVISQPELVNRTIQLLWSAGLCRILAVAPEKDGIILYKHYYESCDKPPLIYYPQIKNVKTLSTIKPCYSKRLFNISFMDFPPFAIYQAGTKMKGFEGRIIEVIAEKLDFSITYINRHETEWGSFQPPRGLLGDVASGTSVLGFGALFPFAERAAGADLVSSRMVIDLTWAVPVGAGPSHPTWFIILVSEFTSSAWLLIFATFCILTTASALLNLFEKQRISGLEWPFHTFGLLLGVPRDLILSRTMTMTCVIGGFLLTAHYQTMMSSRLTAPEKVPDIRTLEQLAESNLTLEGPFNAQQVLKTAARSSSDPILINLANRFKPVLRDFTEASLQIVNKRDLAFFRHGLNMLYTASQNPDTAGHIHLIEQTTIPYFSATLLKKHSCLSFHVHKIAQRLHESGFSNKWINEVRGASLGIESNGPRKLSLSDIKGFLFLLLFGWGLCIFSFVSEVSYSFVFKTMKVNTKIMRSKK